MISLMMQMFKFQMIAGLFGGGGRRGGFSMGRMMDMIMKMSMLPMLTKAIGGAF